MAENPVFERATRFLSALRHCQVLGLRVHSASNEGLTVSEDITPSARLKRWKVGRGGNVFVLSTGEGRIVLRPQ